VKLGARFRLRRRRFGRRGFLFLGLVERLERVCQFLELYDVADYGQAGQYLTGSPIRDVGRHDADDHQIVRAQKERRSATDAIDRDTVYEIRRRVVEICADAPREKTERLRRYGWIAYPPNLNSRFEP
jgi:hypothetical protein